MQMARRRSRQRGRLSFWGPATVWRVSLLLRTVYPLGMDRTRTRTGWLTALLALVVLAFGVGPALASAECGMMARGEACAKMTSATTADVAVAGHVAHGDPALAEADQDPGPAHGGDHTCNHQHCHMTASPAVPPVMDDGSGAPSASAVAIGGDDRLADQPASGLEHPPRG